MIEKYRQKLILRGKIQTEVCLCGALLFLVTTNRTLITELCCVVLIEISGTLLGCVSVQCNTAGCRDNWLFRDRTVLSQYSVKKVQCEDSLDGFVSRNSILRL